jgi:general secretion pathway protein D
MGMPIESIPIETRKNRAASFVAQGRAALDRGQYQLAQQYAVAAEKEKVPESAWLAGEPRPWMLTLDVDKAIRSGKGPILQAAGQRTSEATPSGIQQGAFVTDQDFTRNVPASGTSPGLTNAASAPSLQSIPANGNGNGEELYRKGLEALQAGRREEAMRLFGDAWKDEKNLPVDVRRQLKDKLAMLRPTPLGTNPQRELVSPQDREAQLIRQKIYNDVTRELAATTEIRTSDPMIALDRIKRLRGNVLEADLDPVGKQQLLSIVDRAMQGQETYVQEHKSIIEQSLRNDQIREGISQSMQLRRETDVKISDLVEQFNQLMEQRRYSEAEVLAKQVQELDPGSPIASLMKQKSLVSVRQQENDRIASQKEESFYQAMQNTEISSQAYDDNKPIQFGEPRTWEQISDIRRRRQQELNESRLGPREQEIHKKLANPVDVRFRAAPLATVLENLSRMTEIPIVIDDRALSEVRITRDQAVNLELNTPISLRSALQLILGPLDLNYVIRNEVMEITNREAQRSHTYPETYPVGDLVIPIPNFGLDYDAGMSGALRSAYAMMGRGLNVQTQPVSFLGLANKDAGPVPPNPNILAQSGMGGFPLQGGMGGAGPFGVPGMAGGGGGAADFSQLMALIEGTIQPDTWTSAGGQSRMTEYPGNLTLVISTTSEVHDQIRELLAALRRLQNLQVTIEVRFISLSDNFFERMGFDFDFRIDDNVNRIPAEDEGRSVLIGTTQGGLPTADFDIRIDQNHLGATLPPFGGFDAGAATGIGFAILSDIEAFFFMQALQGDNRTNVLQAPKVTLFDGQFASVNDTAARPFVFSVIPVVGDFAVAQQPVIVVLNEGTQLNVQAVVSNDKRFVRLTLVPMFSRIDEVNTFTFEGTSRSVSNSKKRKDNNNDKTDDETEDAEQVIETRGTTVQQPTFASTSVQTTVSVPDGGTILLGGIKRLREGRNERGLPILSKIPYVKRLFSNVAIGRDASSLMMMVTPRIIIQEEEELVQTGYDPLR